MTFEPWQKDEYLIRLEHIVAKDEDTELSKPVTFDLMEILPGDFDFVEVTLAGNQFIEDSNRLRFKQIGVMNSGEQVRMSKLQSTVITLEPMQIRTFVMMMPSDGMKHLIFKNVFIIVLTVILKNLYDNV